MPPGWQRLRVVSQDGAGSWCWARSASPDHPGERLLRVLPVPRHDAGTRRALQERFLGCHALSHPNLVGLEELQLDASLDGRVQEGIVLVHEAFEGLSLRQWLREHEVMPVRRAVVLLLSILDALAYLHDAGQIHGALTPDVIWLDASGRPRIGGIGPARADALPATQDGGALYLAPECALGATPGAPSDVFVAALILLELISGQPVLADPSRQRALERLLERDVELPRPGPPGLDEGLRGILQMALMRDPQRRTVGPAAMHEALQRWLAPVQEGGVDGSRAVQTMALLSRRMDQMELPAQPRTLREVRRLAGAEQVNASEVSRAARDDLAFSVRLLRRVGGAYYSAYHQGAGEGGVSTVSRAIQLIGFAAVRDLAGTMTTVDRLQPPARAAALDEAYRRARLAGLFAARLCPTALEEEESQLAATLQGLGRILLTCYLPEEAEQLRQVALTRPAGLALAARQILGWPVEELGIGIAQGWGLSEELLRAMRPLPPQAAVRAPQRRADWIRTLASLGNELVDVLEQAPARQRAARITAVIDRYQHALGVAAEAIWAAVDELGAALPPGRSQAARLQEAGGADVSAAQERVAHLTEALRVLRAMAIDRSARVDVEGVARTMGQAVAQAMACRHVAVCLRSSDGRRLVARYVQGPQRVALLQHLSIDLADEGDVFTMLCRRGADTLIQDVAASALAARLPPWYRQHVHGQSFLWLPWMARRAGREEAVGALFIESTAAQPLQISERDLALLRQLRDEAVHALNMAQAHAQHLAV